MLLARTFALILVVAAWSGPAEAQVQVEPVPPPPLSVQVPAFDMFDLDATEDPSIQLPAETMPPAVDVPGVDSVEATAPATLDTADPCRHFTAEERRLLPTLCGTSD